jgi:hypothetical protein
MDLEVQFSGPGYRLWQVDLTTGELSNPLGGLGSAGAGGKGVALTCDANNRLLIGDNLSLRVVNPQTGGIEQDLFSLSLDYFRGLAESPSGVLYATMEDGQVPGLPMYLAIVDRTTGGSNPVRAGQYLGLAHVTDLAWFGPRLFGVSRLTPFLGSNIVEIDPVAGTARIVRPIHF